MTQADLIKSLAGTTVLRGKPATQADVRHMVDALASFIALALARCSAQSCVMAADCTILPAER